MELFICQLTHNIVQQCRTRNNIYSRTTLGIGNGNDREKDNMGATATSQRENIGMTRMTVVVKNVSKTAAKYTLEVLSLGFLALKTRA